MPRESVAALAGLDVWIVDALRYTPHPSHFSLAETLDWIERLKPRRAILTNLHSDLDYEVLRAAAAARRAGLRRPDLYGRGFVAAQSAKIGGILPKFAAGSVK